VVWDVVNQREIEFVDQPDSVWRHDHCRHLQGPLGDRTVLQALKQNLKVKSFVGTSENALRIQIWTALIAICY